jgi:DNA (cytosine-5)-methyltransferase 1
MSNVSASSANPKKDRKSLTVAGLFAGIGGIEHGLHRAEHRTKLLCEIDPAAARILKDRFAQARFESDITKILDIKSFPQVDVIAAGFPCQDLSQAGRTAGITGAQSGLVGHVFRLLDLARAAKSGAWQPKWLLIENVPFMLQLDRGKAMRHLVDALELRGFTWAYRVVDTNAFGLPQRRQRVILLASQTEDPRRVLFAGNETPLQREFSPELWCGFYWTEGLRGLGWAVDGVPTLKGGSTVGIPSPPAIWIPRSGLIGTPQIRDAERLQGFEADWTLAAGEDPAAVKDQVLLRRLRNHRWKLVGNAVSVPVAAWVGAGLGSPGAFDESLSEESLKSGVAWPKAAWGRDNRVYPANVSTWPVRVRTPHLHQFLEHSLVELSERATAGFHSRINADECTLKPLPVFKDAVSRHLERMRSRTRHEVA